MVVDFSENELVALLQKNNVNAFDSLYRKYHHDIYFNILKLTRNTDASNDILQEVFIALWEKRHSLDPGKPLPAWLFVVSYNKSVNYLKKTLRASLHTVYASEKEMEFLSPVADHQLVPDREKLLAEAMEQLSPQKRKVFELCKLQGKTYEETAREMDISKHTVKEYLANAMGYVKLYIRRHPSLILLLTLLQ